MQFCARIAAYWLRLSPAIGKMPKSPCVNPGDPALVAKLSDFAPWPQTAMVERANASLFVQQFVLLPSCFRTAKVCNLSRAGENTHTNANSTSRRCSARLQTSHCLRIEPQIIGYARPIHLNQAVYTPYTHKPISLQPRAGEEQALWHSPTCLQGRSVLNL